MTNATLSFPTSLITLGLLRDAVAGAEWSGNSTVAHSPTASRTVLPLSAAVVRRSGQSAGRHAQADPAHGSPPHESSNVSAKAAHAMTVHTLLRAMIGKLACSAIGGEGGGLALAGAFGQGCVHPAGAFVGGGFVGGHPLVAVGGGVGPGRPAVGCAGCRPRPVLSWLLALC